LKRKTPIYKVPLSYTHNVILVFVRGLQFEFSSRLEPRCWDACLRKKVDARIPSVMLSANFNILDAPLQLHNVSDHEGPGLQQRKNERDTRMRQNELLQRLSVVFFLNFFFWIFDNSRIQNVPSSSDRNANEGRRTVNYPFFFLFDHDYLDELKPSAALDVAPLSYKQERGEGRVQKSDRW